MKKAEILPLSQQISFDPEIYSAVRFIKRTKDAVKL